MRTTMALAMDPLIRFFRRELQVFTWMKASDLEVQDLEVSDTPVSMWNVPVDHQTKRPSEYLTRSTASRKWT